MMHGQKNIKCSSNLHKNQSAGSKFFTGAPQRRHDYCKSYFSLFRQDIVL